MGQQHNTRIGNDTDETISITTTDNNGRNTSQILEKEEVCCIPTPNGYVTLSVFPQDPDNGDFREVSAATYTNYSNRGFIVTKTKGGKFDIVRAKDGTTWEVEDGFQ